MKKIRNLYIGDVYNRNWQENDKRTIYVFGGGVVVHGTIELTKLGRSYLYKTPDNCYVVADKYINKPFANLRLYIAGLYEDKKLMAIELKNVSQRTTRYGYDGTLGDFVDAKSIEKVK